LNLLKLPFRRTGLVVGLLSVSVAVAACGSSSGAATTKSASASDAPTTAAHTGSGFNRSTFVACLKQHGVTLPSRPAGGGPPAGGGGFFGGGGASGSGSGSGAAHGGFFRNNPKLAAAFKACGGGNFRFRRGAGAGRFRLSHTKINQYVACIRQHGYPQMPNPNFSGKGPVFPASIRTNAKFQSASRSCQSILVPARPGGTSGSGTTANS
jgi:hypothetical protein